MNLINLIRIVGYAAAIATVVLVNAHTHSHLLAASLGLNVALVTFGAILYLGEAA